MEARHNVEGGDHDNQASAVRSAPTYKKQTITRLTRHLMEYYIAIVCLYASMSTTLTSRLIMGREKMILYREANATTAPQAVCKQ
eukprot:scaffold39903_cov49-Attheya_sp.AAC.1